eukprot:COSAG01_NODE_40384_length_464_cov_1.136986_2_plen_70_part_01
MDTGEPAEKAENPASLVTPEYGLRAPPEGTELESQQMSNELSVNLLGSYQRLPQDNKKVVTTAAGRRGFC